MVHIQRSVELFRNLIGPVLDDGAPYSGIGMDEFKIVKPIMLPEWDGKLEELPDCIKDRPRWQYGMGSHSSKTRRILGSVMFARLTDEGNEVRIRHLIMEGSSKWVIGRNVTKCRDIIRVGDNTIQLLEDGGIISLQDHDLYCFVPCTVFVQHQNLAAGRAIFRAPVSIGCS